MHYPVSEPSDPDWQHPQSGKKKEAQCGSSSSDFLLRKATFDNSCDPRADLLYYTMRINEQFHVELTVEDFVAFKTGWHMSPEDTHKGK